MSKIVTAESYTLRKQNGDWLGQIVITSDGMISGVTDWGVFAVAWRAYGDRDKFKEFLLSIDQYYFADNIYRYMNYMVVNKKLEQSCARLAEKILPAIQSILKEEITNQTMPQL